jgi:hypothetical protein
MTQPLDLGGVAPTKNKVAMSRGVTRYSIAIGLTFWTRWLRRPGIDRRIGGRGST